MENRLVIRYIYVSDNFRFTDYPTNVTALAESRLSLSCAVEVDTSVRVNWQLLERNIKQKNLPRNGNTYRIVREGQFREHSRLTFSRLFVSNSGYYRCVAKSNGVTIQTDYFYLTIQGSYTLICTVSFICSGRLTGQLHGFLNSRNWYGRHPSKLYSGFDQISFVVLCDENHDGPPMPTFIYHM